MIKIFYGKMSKMGSGDCDILLGKCDLENVEDFIEENKTEMLSFWSNIQKGDYIEIMAYDSFDNMVYNTTIDF